jgi:hypothetical protein
MFCERPSADADTTLKQSSSFGTRDGSVAALMMAKLYRPLVNSIAIPGSGQGLGAEADSGNPSCLERCISTHEIDAAGKRNGEAFIHEGQEQHEWDRWESMARCADMPVMLALELAASW